MNARLGFLILLAVGGACLWLSYMPREKEANQQPTPQPVPADATQVRSSPAPRPSAALQAAESAQAEPQRTEEQQPAEQPDFNPQLKEPPPRHEIAAALDQKCKEMEQRVQAETRDDVLMAELNGLIQAWEFRSELSLEDIANMTKLINPVQAEIRDVRFSMMRTQYQAYREAVAAGQFEFLTAFPAPGTSLEEYSRKQRDLKLKIRKEHDIPPQDFRVFSVGRPRENWQAWVFITRATNPEYMELSDRWNQLNKQRADLLIGYARSIGKMK